MMIKINGKPLFKKVALEYKTYRLIPTPGVRNYHNSLLGKLIASLYRTPRERQSWFTEDAWLELKDIYKVSFKVLMQKDTVEFYLVVPEEKAIEFRRKLESVFEKNVAVEEVTEELARLNPSRCYCAELGLRKNEIFSLATDSKETSAPLDSILSAVRSLEGGDIALLDILLEPYNMRAWQMEARKAHNCLNQGYVPGKKGESDILEIIHSILENIRLTVLSLTRVNKREEQEFKKYREQESRVAEVALIKQEMSAATRRKSGEEVIFTSIRIAVQSENEERARSTGRTIGAAFKDISGDNELELREVAKPLAIKFIYCLENQKKLLTSKTNKLSPNEVGKLMQLPGRSLLIDYPQIRANRFKEVELPKELQHTEIKHVRIGTVTERGAKRQAVIPLEPYEGVEKKDVYDALCTATFGQGGQGSGKSDGYGTVWVCDMLEAGFSCIVIDTADGQVLRKLINGLPADYPDSKVHCIDYGNKVYPVAGSWSDIYGKIKADSEEAELEAIEISEMMTDKFVDFINELSNTSEFSDRMSQYLISCLRAVTTNPVWSQLDLKLSLTSPSYREELLAKPEVQNMSDIVQDLEYLQERAAEGKINSLIDPILSRLNVLTNTQSLANIFCQEPKLDQEGNPVFNLRRTMDNPEGGYGHLVVIKCVANAFPKNQATILGFILNKINFTAFSRVDIDQTERNPVLVWIDEPHRIIKNIEKELSHTLVEFRKYRVKSLFTGHSIEQMGNAADALLDGGAQITSYKTDRLTEFKRFAHKFAPYTDADELYEALPNKWRAINSVRLPSGKPCPAFIADMTPPPKPITDRSYLWMECAKRYGRHWKEVQKYREDKMAKYRQLDKQWYERIFTEKEEAKGANRKKASGK